jgi:hypothetical protein
MACYSVEVTSVARDCERSDAEIFDPERNVEIIMRNFEDYFLLLVMFEH